MTNSEVATWQTDSKTGVAMTLPMARTQRTYERTNERFQDSSENSQLLNAGRAVDNRCRSIVGVISGHHLVAVDALGELCSCGARADDWQEHLADIACAYFGTTPPVEPITLNDVARTRRLLNRRAAMHELRPSVPLVVLGRTQK